MALKWNSSRYYKPTEHDPMIVTVQYIKGSFKEKILTISFHTIYIAIHSMLNFGSVSTTCQVEQEAQLSPRDRAMHHVS